MPEKPRSQRASRAKAKGTSMTVKASETGMAGGRSRHSVKKSSGVVGSISFKDRNASPRTVKGAGRTATSDKLPLPETGSSRSRKRTLPEFGAAQFRKDNRRKT